MVRLSRSVDPYKTLQNLVFDLDRLLLIQQLLETSAGNKMDMVICLVSYDKELTLGTLGKTFSRRHLEIFFLFFLANMPALVAQLDEHPTGDLEVAGLTPPRSATFFHGD